MNKQAVTIAAVKTEVFKFSLLTTNGGHRELFEEAISSIKQPKHKGFKVKKKKKKKMNEEEK